VKKFVVSVRLDLLALITLASALKLFPVWTLMGPPNFVDLFPVLVVIPLTATLSMVAVEAELETATFTAMQTMFALVTL
tara:strand:- start:361 stop:597 length:237 start_codon:yes stop_codon:yes gene_type:complete